MTQITISLPNKKVKKFLDLIGDIDYIKVQDTSFTIPEWQQKEVKKRLQQLKKDPASAINQNEFEKKLNELIK